VTGVQTCALPIYGETFLVSGGNVTLVESWARGRHVERDSKWSVGDLSEALSLLARS
jgi:hypothetical protein